MFLFCSRQRSESIGHVLVVPALEPQLHCQAWVRGTSVLELRLRLVVLCWLCAPTLNLPAELRDLERQIADLAARGAPERCVCLPNQSERRGGGTWHTQCWLEEDWSRAALRAKPGV